MYHVLNSPLTDRDRIAEAVLPAVIQTCSGDRPIVEASLPEHFARQAYAIADAMLIRSGRSSAPLASGGVVHAKPGQEARHSFTEHEKAALEEQKGGPIDFHSARIAKEPLPPAPKFKPGDRVWYPRHDGTREYAAYRESTSVGHLVKTPHALSIVPDRLLHPDLRTIAGGGVLGLEAGRKGRTRDGRIIGPLKQTGLMSHSWSEESIGRFTGSGFFYGPIHTDDRDIVELLPEGA